MKIVVEDAVPYHQSILWRIHDAYFAKRGAAAWTRGDIPYRSTSNFAVARQHARLFVELVAELEARGELGRDRPVRILEIGCGLGTFASNFLRALETESPELATRVVYLLSDYSPAVVAGAAASRDLANRVARGQVVPTLFDLRHPEQLPAEPLAGVLANYVCCVAPLEPVRRDGDAWAGASVTVAADGELGATAEQTAAELLAEPDRRGLFESLDVTIGWRGAPLAALFPDPYHAELVGRIAAPHPRALIRYPRPFLELLRRLREHLIPGGLVLATDYGDPEVAALHATELRKPEYFGNTLNHAVDFAVFDALPDATVLRTRDPLRNLHTVAVRFAAPSARFAAAFERHEVDSADADDALDLAAAARNCLRVDPPELGRAARLFRRAIALDPYSAKLHLELGDIYVDSAMYELAEAALARCAELDEQRVHDVDFSLGRAYARSGRYRDAIASYTRSLARDLHPVTLANISGAHRALGELREAYVALRRSLELAPDHKRHNELMTELRAAWCEQMAAV